jgi:type IV pilus assembly protein PilA
MITILRWRLRLSLKNRTLNQPLVTISDGFTLIELLVVIVILTVFAAIAMPNFLNQAVKAKQTESKQGLTLINRAQSRYRAEYNSFSDSFDRLAIGMGLKGNTTATTTNYLYTIALPNPQSQATVTASPSDNAVRSYTAGNLLHATSGQSQIASVVCESTAPGSDFLTVVQFNAESIDCPANYRRLDDTSVGN